MRNWSAYLLLCLGGLSLLGHGLVPHHHHEAGHVGEHAHHFVHAGAGMAHATRTQEAHAHDAHAHTAQAQEHAHKAVHDEHDHHAQNDEHDHHVHLAASPALSGELALVGHIHDAEDAHHHGPVHGFHTFEFPLNGRDGSLGQELVPQAAAVLVPELPVLALSENHHRLGLPPEPPPISTELFPSSGLRGPPFFIVG